MIVKVTAENFLPFRDAVEFPLANQGLVLIRGNNRVSACSNDNGSGKTSVLHALAWGLFGEDLDGRKADAVANRFTDGMCKVIVDLKDDKGAWAVVRTRRPAKLVVIGGDLPEDSDAADVQEYIESRLGFGLRTFKNAVVFGQGAFERFAHADQAEQMRMLDEIQGLDYRDALAKAKDWKSKLATTMGEIERGIMDDDTVLAETKNNIRTLTDIRNRYEVTKNNAIEALMVRYRSCKNATGKLQAELDSLDAAAKTLEQARREQDILIEREGQLSLARQAEDEAGALNDEASMNLRRFDEKLEALLGHAECPTCRSTIMGSAEMVAERFARDRRAHRKAAEDRAKKYKACLAVSAKALDAVEAQQEVLRAIVGGTEDLGRMVMRLEERTTPKARKLLTERIAGEGAEADKLMANIRKAEAEQWDGAKALALASEKANALVERIASQRARLDRAGAAVDLAAYCVEAFGDRGIRSLIVDGIADYVNNRMQEHLETLTAGEARNTMSAQTELKSGKKKEGISFKPVWAWGGEGKGSGGQDRRVDLATFASMQDLAESRSPRPFPLKAYDEPFDALDARGKEMACEWLRAQAKEYGTVLLITHSDELAGLANPDKIWTIDHGPEGAFLSL